jgi:hypothetical protein
MLMNEFTHTFDLMIWNTGKKLESVFSNNPT